jgi:hypothetical protein
MKLQGAYLKAIKKIQKQKIIYDTRQQRNFPEEIFCSIDQDRI